MLIACAIVIYKLVARRTFTTQSFRIPHEILLAKTFILFCDSSSVIEGLTSNTVSFISLYFKVVVASTMSFLLSLVPFPNIRRLALAAIIIIVWTIIMSNSSTVNANIAND
jgi:hypothetical protein